MPRITASFRRYAIGVAAASLAALSFAGTASAADWQYFNVDGDRLYDVATFDGNANGAPERLSFDIDNDGGWDTVMYNTVGAENLLEVVDYDMDENGTAEARLLDGDQRVGFDYVMLNRDQDGRWDNLGGWQRRIVPGSNVDYTTRINRQNASRDILFNFRMSTGMSLLYPSFPACC